MYRKYLFNISNLVNVGKNTLEVIFYPSEQYSIVDSINYEIPLPDNRAFKRKAPYHSGWDWAPKFETFGLWRNVELVSWKSHRITDVYINTDSISCDNAFLTCSINIESETKGNTEISISDNQNSFCEITKRIELQIGKNNITIPIIIKNPKLWSCNGKGESFLYNFKITSKKDNFYNDKTISTGIRTVKLISETDTIGESFYFQLLEPI